MFLPFKKLHGWADIIGRMQEDMHSGDTLTAIFLIPVNVGIYFTSSGLSENLVSRLLPRKSP
jgi:hypothetical protein